MYSERMEFFASRLAELQLQVAKQLAGLEPSAYAWDVHTNSTPNHISQVAETAIPLATQLMGVPGSGSPGSGSPGSAQAGSAQAGSAQAGACKVVIDQQRTIAKGGLAFSQLKGKKLPLAATERNPHYQECGFAVSGLSSVIHPQNPHLPTVHMNVRYFEIFAPDGTPVNWWIGGGMDLTPYLTYPDDYSYWHKACHDLCGRLDQSTDYYPAFKQQCDDYFYLPHRGEWRGVGGIFFDDFNAVSQDQALDWLLDLVNTYSQTYCRICERRNKIPYTDDQKQFQVWRQSRYTEFNLLYDRGTKFGIQHGGNIDAIMLSMPPQAAWSYNAAALSATQMQYYNSLTEVNTPRFWYQKITDDCL